MKKSLLILLLIALLSTLCTSCTKTQSEDSSQDSTQISISSSTEGNPTKESNDNNDTHTSSSTSTNEEKYNKALSLIAEGKYTEAYELLCEIKTYGPAKEKLKNFFYAPKSVSETIIYLSQNDVSVTAIEYKYDLNGNIVEIREGNHQYSLTYDSKGNVLVGCDIQYPSSKSIIYTYNEKGILIKTIEENGRTTTYSYDQNGLLKNLYWADYVETFEYEFYGNGTIKTITHADDPDYLFDPCVTKYLYDENGNLTRIEQIYPDDPDYPPTVTTITYGTSGIDSVTTEYEDVKVKMTYSYNNKGALIQAECNTYYEEEPEAVYVYKFDDNQLFYSENIYTQERIAIINHTHPETILAVFA